MRVRLFQQEWGRRNQPWSLWFSTLANNKREREIELVCVCNPDFERGYTIEILRYGKQKSGMEHTYKEKRFLCVGVYQIESEKQERKSWFKRTRRDWWCNVCMCVIYRSRDGGRTNPTRKRAAALRDEGNRFRVSSWGQGVGNSPLLLPFRSRSEAAKGAGEVTGMVAGGVRWPGMTPCWPETCVNIS